MSEKVKLPPQAIDLEIAVLGSALIDVSGLNHLIEVIKVKEIFYKIEHQEIFSAIQSLYNHGDPVDILTVINELKKMGKLDLIGGDFYIIQLSQKVSSSAHLDFHCRILIEKFMRRELIKSSHEMIVKASREEFDVFDLLGEYERVLDDINNNSISTTLISEKESDLPKMFVELTSHVRRVTENKGKLSGIPTGINSIDLITNGWQESDLIILAARPSMGKTALSLKFLIEAAKAGFHTSFFSLEMNSKQLTARLASLESNLHLNQILFEGFKKEQYWNSYFDMTAKTEQLPVKIMTPASLTLQEFRTHAKTLKRKFDTKLLVVDYLQLMKSNRKPLNDKNLEVERISAGLKQVAKELSIPVIALSQLSRAVDKVSSKRPNLTHLRDSGAIEQDADLVAFIHRPEYYGLDVDRELVGFDCNSEFIVGKHRNGAVGTVGLYFESNKAKFLNKQPIVDDNLPY